MTNEGIKNLLYKVVDKTMTFLLFLMNLLGWHCLMKLYKFQVYKSHCAFCFIFSSLGIDSPELQIVPDCYGFFHTHIELKHIGKHARPDDNGLFTRLCHPLDAQFFLVCPRHHLIQLTSCLPYGTSSAIIC